MLENAPHTDPCFHSFKTSTADFEVPTRFTFPFHYDPHPLALIACKELQNYLNTQTDWEHPFWKPTKNQAVVMGKMFGVLVVKNAKGNLGYLTAFSGKLADKMEIPSFVPPIYDRLADEGFYAEKEEELNAINRKIEQLESDTSYLKLKAELAHYIATSNQQLAQKRAEIKAAKKARDQQRAKANFENTDQEIDALSKRLIEESKTYQFNYKRLAKEWKEKIAATTLALETHTAVIETLKLTRKSKSAVLQERLFNQYLFLNKAKEVKGPFEIFKTHVNPLPPAGAGDCAAPKLLQYAFQNNYQPICMAEFWWGESPKLEIRKHLHYYPACRGKCEPILGHMLKGVEMDPNPLLTEDAKTKTIATIFEDEYLAVIHKPEGLLSVPGKKTTDSVATRMQAKYPQATGPLMVHRLDMATSGLMLIAKTEEVYKHLQKQFLTHTIKKQYVAVLNGMVEGDKGTIELPLRVDLDNRPSQVVCYEFGKPAKTVWKVIDRSNDTTRVNFYPITGRTHQLRMHAAHPKGLNCPIVGDDLYGSKANRLHLHAERIEFLHPITNELLKTHLPSPF